MRLFATVVSRGVHGAWLEMTIMPSNLKKMIRARMEKTGENYQQALRHVRAQGAEGGETRAPMLVSGSDVAYDTELRDLLAQLRVETTFGVLVGRAPAVAGSANPAVASKLAADLARHPRYFAESGPVDLSVAPAQRDLLLARGAADERKIQMLRSFINEHQTTFSERCRNCERWIWCGHDEREGSCICGQTYRVAFDLAKVHHWSGHRNMRCMDCGAESRMTPPSWGQNPWRVVNESQVQCNACHGKVVEKVETLASMERMGMMAAEATIKLADHYDDANVAALASRAREDLEVVKLHHARVRREVANGAPDREDEDLEVAFERFQRTVEAMQLACKGARLRIGRSA